MNVAVPVYAITRRRWKHSDHMRAAQIRDAAKRLGVGEPCIRARLRRGWSWDEATTLPRGGEWGQP